MMKNKTVEKSTIEIRDVLGRIVISKSNVALGKTEIDVGDLPKGMYFLNVKNERKSFNKKIIIQ